MVQYDPMLSAGNQYVRDSGVTSEEGVVGIEDAVSKHGTDDESPELSDLGHHQSQRMIIMRVILIIIIRGG